MFCFCFTSLLSKASREELLVSLQFSCFFCLSPPYFPSPLSKASRERAFSSLAASMFSHMFPSYFPSLFSKASKEELVLCLWVLGFDLCFLLITNQLISSTLFPSLRLFFFKTVVLCFYSSILSFLFFILFLVFDFFCSCGFCILIGFQVSHFSFFYFVFYWCFLFCNLFCAIIGASPSIVALPFMLSHWGSLIISFLFILFSSYSFRFDF